MVIEKRRAYSSTPRGPSGAAPLRHAHEQRHSALMLSYRARQNELVDAPLAVSSSPLHEVAISSSSSSSSGSRSDDDTNRRGTRTADSLSLHGPHRGTTRSPSEPAQPHPPRTSSAEQSRKGHDRSGGAATNATRGTEAIAFQYYTRQQQRRQQRAQDTPSSKSTTPVRPPRPSAQGGVSAPATPAARRRVSRASRATPPQRVAASLGSRASPSRSATPEPFTPPTRRATSGGGHKISAAKQCRRQTAPTTVSSANPCVVVAAEDEAAASAYRSYESHRLLHYYGGLYPAAARSRRTASASPASPAASPSPPPQVQEDVRDGRTALLEDLKALLAWVLRADGAAEAPPKKGVRDTSMGGSVAALPAVGQQRTRACRNEGRSTAPQCAQAIRQPRGTSASAVAPRQMRSRVVQSRKDGPAAAHSRETSTPPSAPHPVPAFMTTIKPPHRHGLGSGPLPPSLPSSARSDIAAEEADGDSHATEGRRRRQSNSTAAPASPPPEPLSSSIASPTHASSREVPVRRVLPLSGDFDSVFQHVGTAGLAPELSPGAAAARRVYWEQQQQRLLHQQQPQQQQRSDDGQQNQFPNFNALADGTTIAAPRYPESVSTDTARHNAFPQRHEFESISLDDSVLRSDAHSFPSVPLGPDESPVRPSA